MKNNFVKLFIPGLLFFLASFSVNGQSKDAFIGNWSFEAPTAPEGYTSGIIAIKKDSALTSFPDLNYNFPSNWIKVKNDSLIYEIDINSELVLFSLKLVDKQKVTGNAVWSGGETLMILTKKED